MSDHEVAIVKIDRVLPHPDPEVERLELTHIWGWQCCIGKGDFNPGDRAVYIPPDYLVPTDRPSFSFLKKEGKSMERIRVKRLRGTISQGLVIPVPPELAHLPVGTNVIDDLGIIRYEPPEPKSTFGKYVPAPLVYAPKFDVENIQRYPDVFQHGEPVYVTEKIHGANSRYTWARTREGEWQMFCGSRNHWMAQDDTNIWWKILNKHPNIEEWCCRNPEYVLYGEAYGRVQGLQYGAKPNDLFFAAFGVLAFNSWVPFEVARNSILNAGLNWVPLVYEGGFDLEQIEELAEGDSLIPRANHMREGVVILPQEERTHPELGRVQLKCVSNRYLEKGK